MNIKSFEAKAQKETSLWEVNRENVQRLKEALMDCITDENSAALTMTSPKHFAVRRLLSINEIVEEALKTI